MNERRQWGEDATAGLEPPSLPVESSGGSNVHQLFGESRRDPVLLIPFPPPSSSFTCFISPSFSFFFLFLISPDRSHSTMSREQLHHTSDSRDIRHYNGGLAASGSWRFDSYCSFWHRSFLLPFFPHASFFYFVGGTVKQECFNCPPSIRRRAAGRVMEGTRGTRDAPWVGFGRGAGIFSNFCFGWNFLVSYFS